MKNYRHILAIDPSGNFEEGKGTTGICLLNTVLPENKALLGATDVHAKEFNTKEEYWREHTAIISRVIKKFENTIVVIEDFTLDPRRAMQQSHSRMETPKLIGILQLYCDTNNIPYVMQRAHEVKTRWADDILVFKKYLIEKGRCFIIPGTNKYLSRHCKDAVRHAVHFKVFKNNKEEA